MSCHHGNVDLRKTSRSNKTSNWHSGDHHYSLCQCNATQDTHTHNGWKSCREGSFPKRKMKRPIVGHKCNWQEGRFEVNFAVRIDCNQEKNLSKKFKRLRDAHTVGTNSYATYQLNYFKHVNMQKAHRNDYYTNRDLSISKPLEVFTVIHE